MRTIEKCKKRLLFVIVGLIICLGVFGCDSSNTDLAESIVETTKDIADETKEHIEEKTKEEQKENKEDKVEEKVEQGKVEEQNTNNKEEKSVSKEQNKKDKKRSSTRVPKYNGKAYVTVNNNTPTFKDSELKKTSYETYTRLDNLGRCGVARANIGKDLMPKEKRGAIGSVKPSGWQTIKYDIVDGKYLYNRCHLIGFQLTGENANVRNLITGTRYMNVDGMLPFENMVADYIKETSNHVLYEVKPVFEGDNLVATGVYMQAKSVEDKGKGISFNVFVFNVQPGIKINYADGTSVLVNSNGSSADKTREVVSNSKSDTSKVKSNTNRSTNKSSDSKKVTYVLNTNTKKFHLPTCSSASTIADNNKGSFTGNRNELINKGYDACKRCNP